uniref:Uncharacterized protein n=1 Tax=Roseihalotalea indica TaxID=2867963 RepID=A0AA49GP26_9BACT|nr:hypothetical protein K4G66_06785 [Tunicatimonas sp. TK19036]
MKNWFPTLLGAGVIAGSLALTSCEDEFTEADAIALQDSTLTALKKLDNENAIAKDKLDHEQEMAYERYQDSLERIGPIVNYSVTVMAGGSANTSARTEGENFASGATVTVVQGGVSQDATTNAGGVATFGDLRIGNATVIIEAPDHTTMTYTTMLGYPNSGLQEDNVGTTVPIFPLTVEAGASEVSGTAWAELDLTNDEPEFAEGAIVRATLSVGNALGAYGINTGNDKGEIQSASYSNFIVTDTVDASGSYSLVIPNGNADSGNGIFGPALSMDFLPFEAQQTLVVEQGDSLAVISRAAIFGDGTNYDVESLPSVYVEVEEPVNSASGFELGAKANRSALSNSAIDIATRGSGYAVNDTIFFSADSDGEQAGFRVTSIDANGGILGVSGIDNDIDDIDNSFAAYSEEPSVASTSGSGSGATFDLRFVTTYNVFVKNQGSGYYSLPIVTGSAMYYSGYTLTSTVDNNLNDWSSNIVSYILDDVAIIDGKIVADNGVNADTIATTAYLASVPELTVQAPTIRKAIVKPSNISFSNGKITNIGYYDAGEGYTSAPKITIRSVIDGKETSASATSTINSYNGSISGIVVTNGGEGFVANINDIDGDGGQSQNASQSSKPSVSSVKPGATGLNKDFNYGTGKRNGN